MPSVRYRLISGMFKVIGVNRMLDKKGAELEKLMRSYVKKQDNIKVPADKISRHYDFEKRTIDGFDCYVTKQRGVTPNKALLYIFGGGYIMPCDPGDFDLAGQFADYTKREVWFPIYPLAPRYQTVDAVKCVLAVYEKMLEQYAPEDIVFFGTSSGGGLVLSTLMYLKCCTELGLDVGVCQNSPLAQAPSKDISDKVIYEHFVNNPITKAVVIGGMEPMLQLDEVESLIKLFRDNGNDSEFVIYTGYYPEEITEQLESLKSLGTIVIKFGRFIPDRPSRYDDVLGITLSSDNQFAKKIK